MGPSSPKKGHSPQFLVHVCCGQTAGWINMPLGTEIGLGPGHIVLDREPAAPPKRGTAASTPPPFSAHVCRGQTAGSIKMPLGMEIGLNPGHIVLDGDPATPQRDRAPIFGPCVLWPNSWMDQDATWHGIKMPLGSVVNRYPDFRISIVQIDIRM